MPRCLRRVVLAAALVAALPASPALAAQCDSTSKGFVPLMDLTGTYRGQPGGLYPGGGNVPPPAHLAAGIAQAHAITPLDTLGQPDPAGAIVMVSIGMCNTSLEYTVFMPRAASHPGRNPRVAFVNGAQGGQTARSFANPAAPAWGVIDQRVRTAGYHPSQIQVIWLKEANAGPTQPFPTHAELLRDDLRAVVRNARARWPQARICYLSSRIYGGYASTNLNPEPYAYESGFSVRWLIEEQIGGHPDLAFDPPAGPPQAPWLAWGPYLWADGLVPRSDGLTWLCSDFQNDGTHPADAARSKVADLLLDFIATDTTATPWFLVNAASVPPSGGRVSRIEPPRPNPFQRGVAWTLELAAARRVQVDVLTPSGRRLRRLADALLPAGRWPFAWDGRDRHGAPVGAAVYLLVVRVEGEKPWARRVTLVR